MRHFMNRAKTVNRVYGFGVAGLAIAVLAVLLVGLIAWRVYEQDKQGAMSDAKASQSQASTQNNELDENAGYVVFEEWGVRVKSIEGLDHLTGVPRSSPVSQAEELMLITDDMLKLNPACSGEAEGSRPLGALVRAQTPLDQPSNKQFLKDINGYFYYYYSPASSCSPEPANEALQAANLTKVKEAVKSLEAVE